VVTSEEKRNKKGGKEGKRREVDITSRYQKFLVICKNSQVEDTSGA